MPVKQIQRVGNSNGVILTSELKAAGLGGLGDAVEVTVRGNEIVIRHAKLNAAQKPGKNRQTRRDALESTMNQYDDTMRRLADAK
jgi:antitoxin component of MazEF toxin-antitoxin module